MRHGHLLLGAVFVGVSAWVVGCAAGNPTTDLTGAGGTGTAHGSSSGAGGGGGTTASSSSSTASSSSGTGGASSSSASSSASSGTGGTGGGGPPPGLPMGADCTMDSD